MTFRFVEDDHSYWLGGQQLVSVTQVLAQAGMVNGSWFTEEARMRGSYVHRATEMIDRGTLDWEGLDPILRPYCEAYAAFCRDSNPEILLSEKPLYHAQYIFAGTPDRVLRMHGREVIVDIKTGSPAPANWLQVAAYRELVNVNEDIRAIQGGTIYLQDDGKYRFQTVNLKEMKRDFNIFLAALSVARWKKENL